ncbi:STE20-related kinase adapter protein alpha isoform X2 [Macaca nemestrina]|uniref:STE20-related kinase adapter protein alpha isoform X2 n=1 Tax=Macaca nemestrina TaxID=9545 RepID=UPI0039B83F9D
MSFLRWVSEKFIVEGLRDLELFGEPLPKELFKHRLVRTLSARALLDSAGPGASHTFPKDFFCLETNDASSESIASFSKQEVMSSFLPEGGCYELLTVIGKGFEDLMTVNLARYKPTGEYVTVRRINLEACSNEMVTFLQGELHVSKLFNHPNIVPYRATFIADNELWVVTSFMAYGSAKDLICTHFMDGMNELAIAYILQGVLKALDYIHHMGYVHRSVKASHILISLDGKVYLSGLRSNLSMISHGQRQRVVHDFPKYSVKVLPWLSPEVLQQNLQGYDAKSDIYSVGITACELANGHVPFKDMPATQMLLEKLNGTVPCLLDTSTIPAEELTMSPSRSVANSGLSDSLTTSTPRPSNGDSPSHPYHRTFSPYFHHFVEQCLQRNPDARPSASTLLNHSFFKQSWLRQPICHQAMGPCPMVSWDPEQQDLSPTSLFSPRSSDVPQRLCLNCFVLSPPSPILRAASLRTIVESLAW